MARWLWLLPLTGLLGLAPVAVPWLAEGSGHEQDGAVYTVAQLQGRLAHHPGAWVGWAVRVRALAEPCPAWGSPHGPLHCREPEPVLVDPAGTDLADPLPLVVGPGSPLLAALRRLPLAGGWVPALPSPAWDVLNTYRVRLQAAPGSNCDAATCFAALLLDVTPGTPGEG
jgi:hypothetical protein